MKICPTCNKEYPLDHDICLDDFTSLTFKMTNSDENTTSQAANGDIVNEIEPDQCNKHAESEPLKPEAEPFVEHVKPKTSEKTVDPNSVPEWSMPKDEKSSGSSAKGFKDIFDDLKNRFNKAQDTASTSILPQGLIDAGWQLCADSPVERTPFWDRYRIELHSVKAFFNRYISTPLTSQESYDVLKSHQLPGVCRVIDSGIVSIGGRNFSYDVTQNSSENQPFTQYVKSIRQLSNEGADHNAWRLLCALCQWLHEFDTHKIRPMTVQPEYLSIKHEQHGIFFELTTVATIDTGDGVERYEPNMAVSTNLIAAPYSSPELTLRNMLFPSRSVVFDVAQLVVHVRFGAPLSLEDIQKGRIPFAILQNSRLVSALKGMLWPVPEERWTIDDAYQFTNNPEHILEVPPWEKLKPGAAANAFALAGNQFWTIDSLIEFIANSSDWSAPLANTDQILKWVIEHTRFSSEARYLRSQYHDVGKSADFVLVQLMRTVSAPDRPVTWRNLDFSNDQVEDTLIAIAQEALTGNAEGIKSVNDLFAADLRGAFSPVSLTSFHSSTSKAS